jgi:citrate synthase
MEPWRTGLVRTDETHIWIRGYDITALMRQGSFADTVFLLHRGRLPNAGERKLLDALLVASADHGAGAPSCATARLAASGNRGSLSAAVAAGILAIGDEHGGAGSLLMETIAASVDEAHRDSVTLAVVAARLVERASAEQSRLPGVGHRTHTVDPRVAVLFDMAREAGIAGDGIAFVLAMEEAVRAQIKPMPINIDGAVAAILHDLGFSPDAGRLIFIIGRVAGITAEVAEEHQRERPMRVRIPVQYDGEPPRNMD